MGVLHINEDVHMGRDYLPFTYHRVLNTPETKAVVCDSGHGEIVGYAAGYLADNENTLVLSSGRVKRSHQGRGHSRRMLEAIRMHFLSTSSKVKEEVLVTKGNTLVQTKTAFHLEYKEILQRALLHFIIDESFDSSSFKDTIISKPASNVQNLSALKRCDAVEHLDKALNKCRESGLLYPHNYIITNWSPHTVTVDSAGTILSANDVVFLSDGFCEARQAEQGTSRMNLATTPSGVEGSEARPCAELVDNGCRSSTSYSIWNKEVGCHKTHDRCTVVNHSHFQSRQNNLDKRCPSPGRALCLKAENDVKRGFDYNFINKDSSNISFTGECSFLSFGNYFPCKLGLAYNVDIYFPNWFCFQCTADAIKCHLQHHLAVAFSQRCEKIHLIIFIQADGLQAKTVSKVMQTLGLKPVEWNVKNLHLYGKIIN